MELPWTLRLKPGKPINGGLGRREVCLLRGPRRGALILSTRISLRLRMSMTVVYVEASQRMHTQDDEWKQRLCG